MKDRKNTFWYSKNFAKQGLSHLYIWCCPTEVMIYNPHIKKMDLRIAGGYFISYPMNSKGFWFYCSSHSLRKIIETRNAKVLKDFEPSGSIFFFIRLSLRKSMNRVGCPSIKVSWLFFKEIKLWSLKINQFRSNQFLLILYYKV